MMKINIHIFVLYDEMGEKQYYFIFYENNDEFC
jgi:hypothetical protein